MLPPPDLLLELQILTEDSRQLTLTAQSTRGNQIVATLFWSLLMRFVVCWLVVFKLVFTAKSSAAAEKIQSVRIWPSPDSTRVVFDLSGRVQYRLLPQQGNVVQLDLSNVSSPSLGRMSGESDQSKISGVQRQAGNGIGLLVELTRPAQGKAFSLPPSAKLRSPPGA